MERIVPGRWQPRYRPGTAFDDGDHVFALTARIAKLGDGSGGMGQSGFLYRQPCLIAAIDPTQSLEGWLAIPDSGRSPPWRQRPCARGWQVANCDPIHPFFTYLKFCVAS